MKMLHMFDSIFDISKITLSILSKALNFRYPFTSTLYTALKYKVI